MVHNGEFAAVALDEKLNKAIDDITNNPDKWESDYLPKLRKFVAVVDELPEDDPNYLYKETVVGTRETLDTKAKEGIINRFWRRMEEKFNQQKAAKSTSLPSQDRQMLSGTTSAINNSHSNHAAESNTGSDTILDAEFAGNSTPSMDRKMTSIDQLEPGLFHSKKRRDLFQAKLAFALCLSHVVKSSIAIQVKG